MLNRQPNYMINLLKVKYIAVFTLICSTYGCNKWNTDQPLSPVSTRDVVCEINSIGDGHSKCHDGDVVSFLPQRWGNEQLPLTATSLLCDFRYPVAMNNGGVVCVYTAKRLSALINKMKSDANVDAKPEGK